MVETRENLEFPGAHKMRSFLLNEWNYQTQITKLQIGLNYQFPNTQTKGYFLSFGYWNFLIGYFRFFLFTFIGYFKTL